MHDKLLYNVNLVDEWELDKQSRIGGMVKFGRKW